MNNTTTTKRNLTIAAIFIVAILVVGVGTLAVTSAQSAFAFKKGTRDNGNSKNGNTVTIQECKQAAIQSGWDNDQEQECENLICTHPGENATCVQEAAAAPTPIPTLVKKTCEQCFTSLLTQAQINFVVNAFDESSLAEHCATLQNSGITEDDLRDALSGAGVSGTTANELIACLLQAGVVFRIP
jgi:hypothetical protein